MRDAVHEGREVVIGRNSRVWRAVARNPAVVSRFHDALSHRQLEDFVFRPDDRVWVFSFSRNPSKNSRLLSRLEQARVGAVVYVSSASTIVNRVSRCYEYPRIKALAEDEARRRLRARILTLGLVYESLGELPAGLNAATSLQELMQFLLRPEWTDDVGSARRLFGPIACPFSSAIESAAFRIYGVLQSSCGRRPCLLRPLDYLLRAVGWRWYGYVYLSNRLWFSTKS